MGNTLGGRVNNKPGPLDTAPWPSGQGRRGTRRLPLGAAAGTRRVWLGRTGPVTPSTPLTPLPAGLGVAAPGAGSGRCPLSQRPHCFSRGRPGLGAGPADGAMEDAPPAARSRPRECQGPPLWGIRQRCQLPRGTHRGAETGTVSPLSHRTGPSGCSGPAVRGLDQPFLCLWQPAASDTWSPGPRERPSPTSSCLAPQGPLRDPPQSPPGPATAAEP